MTTTLRGQNRFGILMSLLVLLLVACGGSEGSSEADPVSADGGATDSSDSGDDDGAIDDGAAADETPYFEGKDVTIVVPYGTGGGTDSVARLVARELSAYLPGEPTIQVVNDDGGGGTVGANKFHKERPADGTAMMVSATPIIFKQLAGDELVEYDFTEWTAVGGQSGGGVTVISPDTGYTGDDLAQLAEVSATGAAVSHLSGVGATFYFFHELGMDLKGIFGYENSAATLVSFEQGETTLADGSLSVYLEQVEPLIEAGKAVPVMTKGSFERNERLPDIPSHAEVWEAVHGSHDGPAWETWEGLHAVAYGLEKIFWLPAGVPDEVADIVKQAFDDLAADPDFEDAMWEQLGADPLVTGAELEDQVKLLAVPQESMDRFVEVMRDQFGYEQ